MASKPLKPHQRAIVIAAVLTLVSWFILPLQLVLLPLQFLNTHLHEMAHAITAVATGGEAHYIAVYADSSGVTQVSGGSGILVSMAGYLGASIAGAALLYFARSSSRAKNGLTGLGIVLLFSCLVWVRGDGVGLVTGYGWAALLLLLGWKLKGDHALIAIQIVAMQQCLNSAQSLLTLFGLSAAGHSQNDAGILEAMTGIPAIAVASLWLVAGLLLLVFTLPKAWHEKPT
ncbi:MAG: M50 family metallopeptidase [Fimbriimonas sp.]